MRASLAMTGKKATHTSVSSASYAHSARRCIATSRASSRIAAMTACRPSPSSKSVRMVAHNSSSSLEPSARAFRDTLRVPARAPASACFFMPMRAATTARTASLTASGTCSAMTVRSSASPTRESSCCSSASAGAGADDEAAGTATFPGGAASCCGCDAHAPEPRCAGSSWCCDGGSGAGVKGGWARIGLGIAYGKGCCGKPGSAGSTGAPGAHGSDSPTAQSRSARRTALRKAASFLEFASSCRRAARSSPCSALSSSAC
mmetsp:Transcript_38625/g.90312  ORF Transcript_38625/g.90312 Transcript_38625/m.90312 type:complete len:261 (+) Transcript_38625:1291-2073(+)